MGMGKYILQRLAFALLVILGVSVAVFFITHVVGDPVSVMLPLQATQEQRMALPQQLGHDKPLLEQLWVFLSSAARLDFGISWWQNVPCMDVILERLPATLQLVTLGIAIAVAVAIPLGVIAAYKPGSLLTVL
jgi:peptide/nickel transport system permease protein